MQSRDAAFRRTVTVKLLPSAVPPSRRGMLVVSSPRGNVARRRSRPLNRTGGMASVWADGVRKICHITMDSANEETPDWLSFVSFRLSRLWLRTCKHVHTSIG